jgi:hypothetical protein
MDFLSIENMVSILLQKLRMISRHFLKTLFTMQSRDHLRGSEEWLREENLLTHFAISYLTWLFGWDADNTAHD